VGKPLGLAADSAEGRRWLWLLWRKYPYVDTELQDALSSRVNPFRGLQSPRQDLGSPPGRASHGTPGRTV